VISGKHDGKPFVNEVYLGCTGGAASPYADGWLTILHAGNAGMCFQDSIEMDELRHPILVRSRRLMPDSEGAGRFRGALGAYSEFDPLSGELTVAYVSDGNFKPAAGARGGLAGGASSQFVRRTDGSLDAQPGCAEVTLKPGECRVSISCGGGGYGPPKERALDRVLHDIAEGWISRERAAEVYGVVVAPDGTTESQLTDKARR
jgi:N-methylhydantoinase B